MEKIKTNKSVVIVCMEGGGNFGACLQSYALQQVLLKLEYLPTIWFVKDLKFNFKSFFYYILSFVGVFEFWVWLRMPRNDMSFYSNSRMWRKKHYREVKFFLPFQLSRFVDNVECFCVGSDQVWNTYHHFYPELFLSFAKNARRISYASSLGTRMIKNEYCDVVKNYLLKFQKISVREEIGRRILSDLTKRTDIETVLDPTLLLDSNFWIDFCKDAKFYFQMPKRYILCYFLGENYDYELELNRIKKYYGIDDVIIIPSVESSKVQIVRATVCDNITPTEFVWLIAHASLVCTDSFHATIFSINLRREFVVFKRFSDECVDSQNSRIYHILNLFNLMSRLYDVEGLNWTTSIDWDATLKILKCERLSSLTWLKTAIK